MYLHAQKAGQKGGFAIADGAGHAVVVEYIDNEMVVIETPVIEYRGSTLLSKGIIFLL